MRRSVHLETTIARYLTARQSNDVVLAADRKLTIEWWTQHRQRFEVFISDFVLREAARGDPHAASKRLAALADITVLDMTEDARELAREIVDRRIVPEKAVEDASHRAIATAQGMDFVPTCGMAATHFP